MKIIRLCVAFSVVLFFASCTLAPTWSIDGKWQQIEGNETLQFFKNGTVSMISGTTSLTSTYKFSDPKNITIAVGSFGDLALKVKIEKNELSLTNAEGKVVKFRKVN